MKLSKFEGVALGQHQSSGHMKGEEGHPGSHNTVLHVAYNHWALRNECGAQVWKRKTPPEWAASHELAFIIFVVSWAHVGFSYGSRRLSRCLGCTSALPCNTCPPPSRPYPPGCSWPGLLMLSLRPGSPSPDSVSLVWLRMQRVQQPCRTVPPRPTTLQVTLVGAVVCGPDEACTETRRGRFREQFLKASNNWRCEHEKYGNRCFSVKYSASFEQKNKINYEKIDIIIYVLIYFICTLSLCIWITYSRNIENMKIT
jgi:hypothetical protein